MPNPPPAALPAAAATLAQTRTFVATFFTASLNLSNPSELPQHSEAALATTAITIATSGGMPSCLACSAAMVAAAATPAKIAAAAPPDTTTAATAATALAIEATS